MGAQWTRNATAAEIKTALSARWATLKMTATLRANVVARMQNSAAFNIANI